MDHATRWQTKYEALQHFIKREGHAAVPTEHIETTPSGTVALGDWVSHQRTMRKKGLLSPEREQTLAGLPGWTWGPLRRGPKKSAEKTELIRQLRKQNVRPRDIAFQVQLSRQRIYQIIKKEGL